MKTYEGMFLVDTKESKKGKDSVEEHIRTLVAKCGGEVKEFEIWDERKLAYEIKGTTNGTYFLTYFTGESDTVSRLNRECELSPVVLRSLILRVKAIPDRTVEIPEAAEEEHAPAEKPTPEPGSDGEAKTGDDVPAGTEYNEAEASPGEEIKDMGDGEAPPAPEESIPSEETDRSPEDAPEGTAHGGDTGEEESKSD